MPNAFSIFVVVGLILLPSSLSAQRFGNRNVATPEEAQAQSAAAIGSLNSYLNEIGYAQLAKRAETVAAIGSREEADQRKAEVRAKIIELVGGLPEASGPVVVERFETIEEDGFTIENIAYESFPGYWVTANVYVPEGTAPFPAMVIAPGHGAGKSSQFNWSANFARAGILVLSIDPMGQGERMQHFDTDLGVSKVEFAGEHEHANQTSLLVGKHIARYWFADGVRGVDYLTERSDVDASRIGTFGCSGGGTAAAYLAAMDTRISVAAVSSFTTSFKELLPGWGPQDAEQTLPRFISSGLDFADWVELAAPRPYAIIAFEEDFFPIAGAKWTHEEAERFYSLYGAEDQLELIHGPGGHCNLGSVAPQLLAFLIKHLKGPNAPVPEFQRFRVQDPYELTATPTGQLSTSIGGDTAEDIARRTLGELGSRTKPLSSQTELVVFKKELEEDIRELASVVAMPTEDAPKVATALKEQLEGYRLETVSLESDPGITLNGLVAIPDQAGPHSVVLWMDAKPVERIVNDADFIRLAKAGNIVLAIHPRGVLGDPSPDGNKLALGQYMPVLQRAVAVGKTIVGIRVDDTIRIVNWLTNLPDAKTTSVTLYGKGAQGMVALHAAAIDSRITEIFVESTLVSYRMAVEAGLHKNLSEVVIPSVLTAYDTGDLLNAISPRPVTLINPANPMGQRVRESVVRSELPAVFETDENLGVSGRIQIVNRGFRDPLPIK